jgi:hypothetical protein
MLYSTRTKVFVNRWFCKLCAPKMGTFREIYPHHHKLEKNIWTSGQLYKSIDNQIQVSLTWNIDMWWMCILLFAVNVSICCCHAKPTYKSIQSELRYTMYLLYIFQHYTLRNMFEDSSSWDVEVWVDLNYFAKVQIFRLWVVQSRPKSLRMVYTRP